MLTIPVVAVLVSVDETVLDWLVILVDVSVEV